MILTGIETENQKTFENLMPQAAAAKLADPERGWFALGAVCPEGGEEYAAGVLIFSVEEGFDGEEERTAAVVQWLYVSEKFRRRGAARELLRELLRIAEGAGTDDLLCDVPMPSEYNELCAFLEAMGCDVVLTDRYEASVTVGELAGHPLLRSESPATGIAPLSEVPDFYFRQYIEEAKKLSDVPDTLNPDPSYYDGGVSCAFHTGGTVRGALLVTAVPGGGLEMEFLRAAEKTGAAMLNMLRCSVRAAARSYPPEMTVHIPCRSRAAALVIGRLFPELRPDLVRRAFLRLREPKEIDSADNGQEGELKDVHS